jgi:hypothetical protein
MLVMRELIEKERKRLSIIGTHVKENEREREKGKTHIRKFIFNRART